MDGKQIEKKLQEIILQRTGINFAKCEDKREEVFWGQNLNIPIRNLVCVIMDIQKNWDIRFTDEDVDMKRIITYNGLLKNILKKINVG